MTDALNQPEDDLLRKLKWLMFFRLLFTTLLIGSTIILHLTESPSPLSQPLLGLYGLITGVFLLSLVYAFSARWIKRKRLFAYFQIGIDTCIVSLIIFLTGSFSSIFSFLYLLVIITASMLLYRRGSMIMAALCCIQYGILIDLEYYSIISPFGAESSSLASSYAWSYVLYKMLFIMAACFGVSFLSSLLSEQARKTKKELLAMEDHVKRVEKMAGMGEMAAGLAHEIRNPLAALSSSIQLIRENSPYNLDQEKLMQIVLREAERLSSLVNNFLLFAKPPAGKKEVLELGKALSETVELFEKDSNCRRRITITKQIQSDVWIEMDPMHLRQILWNLLLNAAEAIKSNGVIHIKMLPLRNKLAVVQVSDNGCGMTRDILRSIFDPFFTTKPNGTGLGLSIVHSILESYDSRLDVESEINKGTTFTMKLKRTNPPD